MSQVSVRISSKHQIAVPATVRKELRLEAGDRLLVQIRDGVIVLVPEGDDVVDRLRGLYRDVWKGDVRSYLEEERDARDNPAQS